MRKKKLRLRVKCLLCNKLKLSLFASHFPVVQLQLPHPVDHSSFPVTSSIPICCHACPFIHGRDTSPSDCDGYRNGRGSSQRKGKKLYPYSFTSDSVGSNTFISVIFSLLRNFQYTRVYSILVNK